jgi:uncharacterized protein (UPF0332 family)
MNWSPGRDTILRMLNAGELEQVAPNDEFAQTLIEKAGKHLVTAGLLRDTDLEIAFDALYTAARLSVTALLATQGLRPTTKGGHAAPINAVRAQLGAHVKVLRSYDRLRVTRNRTDYPSPGASLSVDDVTEGIDRATDIVDAAAAVLPQLPVFVR